MKRKGTSDRAFTLVELLVVIAILAVLIAMLLPVLIAAKRHAQQVRCAANLQQLGQAMTMYTQHCGYFPCAGFDVAGGDAAETWPVRLRKVLGGDQKVFYCPAQDSRCEWKADAAGVVQLAQVEHTYFGYEIGERLLLTGVGGGSGAWFSYGCNGSGAPGGAGFAKNRGIGGVFYSTPLVPPFTPLSISIVRKASTIRRPSEFIVMADTTANGYRDLFIHPYNSSIGAGSEDIVGNVHRNGANVLFFDGHVQWSLQSQITTKYPPVPEEATKQRLWNADSEPARAW